MPLSFTAAFFSANITRFPRSGDGLSLGYVYIYMLLLITPKNYPSHQTLQTLSNLSRDHPVDNPGVIPQKLGKLFNVFSMSVFKRAGLG
jgi:hypothetical protein